MASFNDTPTICERAISPPLRMASATSPALPRPTPTRPCLSPTTISALKLKRRPPLTTLAERLMKTTFSVNSCPECASKVGSGSGRRAVRDWVRADRRVVAAAVAAVLAGLVVRCSLLWLVLPQYCFVNVKTANRLRGRHRPRLSPCHENARRCGRKRLV